MRLFEADTFEERIRSVENRAGRVAWEVLVYMLLLAMISYERITGEPAGTFIAFLLVPLAASAIAGMIVRHKAGLGEKDIKEERKRVKATATNKSSQRKQFKWAMAWGVLVIVAAWPLEDFDWEWRVVLLISVPLFWYVSYRFKGLRDEVPS